MSLLGSLTQPPPETFSSTFLFNTLFLKAQLKCHFSLVYAWNLSLPCKSPGHEVGWNSGKGISQGSLRLCGGWRIKRIERSQDSSKVGIGEIIHNQVKLQEEQSWKQKGWVLRGEWLTSEIGNQCWDVPFVCGMWCGADSRWQCLPCVTTVCYCFTDWFCLPCDAVIS